MELYKKHSTPSIYATKAYELILSGVSQFDTKLDQGLLLDSMMCQCAVFTRMLGGEHAFYDLLDRLRNFDFDSEESSGDLSGYH